MRRQTEKKLDVGLSPPKKSTKYGETQMQIAKAYDFSQMHSYDFGVLLVPFIVRNYTTK